ncbi:flagellar hook-length control protein FliK [Marinomonas algarum]|uniref:Flagellar hook-length control protein FliK n=1 Tax=Marinomonas algarum TaxID=2883105 RepID=A0A9X1LCF2_9GAMM|nr:flagellar hook-length control protein FliK [Marinomonas algarum]MCB5161969.1 flagellar hook-length control protein FliK [Marinomonas algarum]
MRTDSNTVLPLSTESSAKSSSLLKVASGKGADFHQRFQEAQSSPIVQRSASSSDALVAEEATSALTAEPPLEKKLLPEQEATPSPLLSSENSRSISPSEVSTVAPISTEKVLESDVVVSLVSKEKSELGDQPDPSIKSDDLKSVLTTLSVDSDDTVEGGEQVNFVGKSGNVLQLEGEQSPANKEGLPSPKQPLVGVTGLASVRQANSQSIDTAESVRLSSASASASASAAVMTSMDETPVVGVTTEVQQEETVGIVSLSSADGSNEPTLSAVQPRETFVSEEKVQADSLPKRGEASASTLAALSGLMKVEKTPQPAILPDAVEEDGKIDLAPAEDPSELSWVLSQMGAGAASVKASMNNQEGVVDSNKVQEKSTVVPSMMTGTTLVGGQKEPLGNVDGFGVEGDATLETGDDVAPEDSLLTNEPIELRKKEQDALIGRMAAQIEGAAGEKGRLDSHDIGGLNSSLQNAANRSTAGGLGINAGATASQANNLAMNVPPNHPNWASEMSQKVAWVARDGGHTAHIRLDPPELGSLTVKISVDSDTNTQVSFVAATPQARDLLEGQMARLRDMLAQQGMDLSRADVDVSQQDSANAQYQGEGGSQGRKGDGAIGNEEEVDDLLLTNNTYVSASGVDYYA